MKSYVVIDQIYKLRDAGHPIKKIAKILAISKNTVKRHLRRIVEEEPAPALKPTAATAELAWKLSLNWEQICDKRRQGYTAKQIYADYQPPVSYSQFCRKLREDLKLPSEIAIRLAHNPGEKIQVDFCDGVTITDHRSGQKSKTHLFVGVLPFSSYCFGTFVPDQKLQTFIRAHEAMWAYLDGVTPYVVIDNLKSGVKKAHIYDPELNPTYCDYGNHCKFAVLPARPYTPRDKAAVEANIGAIQRSFYQEVREQNFYSLHELNERFRRFLDAFNERMMPDHGVSRRDRFQVEKEILLPLPVEAYELCEWREAKVHPDCCVQVNKSFYSVPFQFRGQIVRVKISDNLVSIFDQETNAISCHQRAKKIGAVVTDDRHFPDKLVQSNLFDVKRALAKAAAIGPKVEEMAKLQLCSERPLRYLRRIQGVVRLLDQGLSREALEFAASQALTFSKYQLAFIRACAQQYNLSGNRLKACRPERDPEATLLRGGYDV